MAEPAPMKVFISHRFDDLERAKTLAAALLAAGFDAWLDAWEVLAGDNFVAAMQKGISEAVVWLVLFGLRETMPWKEKIALRETNHHGKTIHVVGCCAAPGAWVRAMCRCPI